MTGPTTLQQAYPLAWPALTARTPSHKRRASPFSVGLATTRDQLLNELRLLGARDVVISSNLALRRDGLPLANASEPLDPGVAVYFVRGYPKLRPFVVACDSYAKVGANLRAISATIGALRTIDRHGASEMLEQAMQGFAALPPAPAAPVERPWWEVLEVQPTATAAQVAEAYRRLAVVHHPDRPGGSHERMVALNRALAAAKEAGR